MSDSSLSRNLSAEEKKNLFGNAYINMLWHSSADPRFPYWVHLPDSYMENPASEYRLLVIVHGTGCNVEHYIETAKELADKNNLAILAPLFPGGLIDADDFNSYKLLSDHGVRYDQILLAMLEDMKDRYPEVKTDKFFLFGHSGGGQFVNRFLLVHPDRLLGASIGAPGRPTFINPEEDYFWGTRDFRKYFDKDLDLEEVRKVPVQITVGEHDTKFIGESVYGTCRVDRMKSLKKNFEDNGICVRLDILPGLEHGNGLPGEPPLDGDAIRIHAAEEFFLTIK